MYNKVMREKKSKQVFPDEIFSGMSAGQVKEVVNDYETSVTTRRVSVRCNLGSMSDSMEKIRSGQWTSRNQDKVE